MLSWLKATVQGLKLHSNKLYDQTVYKEKLTSFWVGNFFYV